MWYFLHLCIVKTIQMKTLNIISFFNNANVSICDMMKRSMSVVFNQERVDYKQDYGSRTR